MHSSLTSGDNTFQLQDAQSLRGSIAKQAESLDTLGKQIQSLIPDPDTQRTFNLQNAIRRAISQYIKDNLLVLPMLPTPHEFERYKQERLSRNYDNTTSTNEIRVKKVAVTTGWSPSNVSHESTESVEDPLIEQIQIVTNYIEQARRAHRYEEVASLEENLRMLKKTFNKRQTAATQ